MSLEHAPTRQKQQAAPRSSYSINEWIALHGVSRSYWYTLRKRGLGPATMNINGMTRISVEADQRWTAEREAASA